MDITELASKKLSELRAIAREMEIAGFSTMKKQDLVYQIMASQAQTSGLDFRGGVLEIIEDDKQTMGFLRTHNYLPGANDIYVSNSQIRRLSLQTGDMVVGQVRVPKDNEKYYSLLRVEAVNDGPPELAKSRPRYESLTPIFPDQKLKLETRPNILSTRLMDLIAPIGRGQRGLIVSPPKAGKTTVLKEIA
ncbi:MAG: Rho termination factor N-terminal domain-containing protein, partial [Anaerolineales bacterium]|nr:Rho termination factor N-terminal domain-containing protein [Anaerolineales bacterium]